MTLPLPTIPIPARLVSILAVKIAVYRSGENPKPTTLENTAPLVLTAQVRAERVYWQSRNRR